MRPRHSDFCDRCDWRDSIGQRGSPAPPRSLAQRISPGRRWALRRRVHREHPPVPATIAGVSDGEQAKSRRRRGRRRGRRAA
ncbi:NUDIX hydrolase, partial [Mycobacterium tuberculosis]|nr:NUDIX hydrolase [Mycobacterium tuberculosis]